MSDQEKDPTPETESVTEVQAAAPETNAASEADVSISEAAAPGSEGAPAPLGRPPFAKIFAGVLAVLAVWFLAGIAGGVKQQACIDKAVAKYGQVNDPKSVANLARKQAAERCSDSAF